MGNASLCYRPLSPANRVFPWKTAGVFPEKAGKVYRTRPFRIDVPHSLQDCRQIKLNVPVQYGMTSELDVLVKRYEDSDEAGAVLSGLEADMFL